MTRGSRHARAIESALVLMEMTSEELAITCGALFAVLEVRFGRDAARTKVKELADDCFPVNPPTTKGNC